MVRALCTLRNRCYVVVSILAGGLLTKLGVLESPLRAPQWPCGTNDDAPRSLLVNSVGRHTFLRVPSALDAVGVLPRVIRNRLSRVTLGTIRSVLVLCGLPLGNVSFSRQ